MTDGETRFSLSTITSLVERINQRIEDSYYETITLQRFEERVPDDSVYAQSYVIGEEGEDIFANDHFIVWSSGLKIFSNAELIDKENQFYQYMTLHSELLKISIPMKVPKDLNSSELENEYANTAISDNIKKSGILFENVETQKRSLSGIVSSDVQGVDSELIISADVLKRRLSGKNMDATLKYAIINAKSVKKNIEALNFALASCSRNYTHTAWHLMYSLLDLYRHIDRQSQK